MKNKNIIGILLDVAIIAVNLATIVLLVRRESEE